MDRHRIRNSLLLLLTAAIWGVAFVAQRKGMDYVGPFTFTSVRSLIGCASLLPVIPLVSRMNRASGAPKAQPADRRTLLLGGLCCGALLFVGSSLQQVALQHTTVGKAGFITALYIVIVPVIGLLRGKRCSLALWAGVLLARAGLYRLCIHEVFPVSFNDVLLLIGAFVFSLHILFVDHFVQKVDGLRLSQAQSLVCGLIAAIPMLLLESPRPDNLLAAWLPILYAGALSSGVGYTLQIVAQRGMHPTLVSLILSLESVISVLAGWALLNQRLSARELIGCALMFTAILLAQLPGRGAKKARSLSLEGAP
ncbi:MAG: DMT family transporter [Eubacteriales bacterium]|nr:DMT family transporter [Eubacteriales bacterium]